MIAGFTPARLHAIAKPPKTGANALDPSGEAKVSGGRRTPPQSLRDSSPASGGASTAQILHRNPGRWLAPRDGGGVPRRPQNGAVQPPPRACTRATAVVWRTAVACTTLRLAVSAVAWAVTTSV